MGDELRESVRTQYAEAARDVQGGGAFCCGTEACCEVDSTADRYSGEELDGLPGGAVGASLGCGTPVALADLSPGQVVLDLGSGGGIDVLLSAWQVSSGVKAYGLDMTEEMLDLARRNQLEAGVENVEFRKSSCTWLTRSGLHVALKPPEA